jgi:predicted phage terminase large subunit-like protein
MRSSLVPGRGDVIAESRRRCGRFYDFVQLAWNQVEDSTYMDNWHIEAICDHLEAMARGKIGNLLINQPPGTTKTLLCSILFPAWVWTWWPSARFLVASYAQDLSTKASNNCRSVIESDWYCERFGRLLRNQNKETRFQNTDGGWRLATSIGGRGTGEHPDFVICDDPIKAEDSRSPLKRQRVREWWDGTISMRGEIRGVRRLIVMQRLHEDDLAGHVIRQGGYEKIILPMEFEPNRMEPTSLGWTDPRTTDGELLWEQAYPRAKVDQSKIRLSFDAPGQLQQRPNPLTGSIYRLEDFRYFTIEFVDGVEFVVVDDDAGSRRYEASRCTWFQTCDTAQKTGKENDFTVVGTFLRTPDHDLLVYDMRRERVAIPDQYAMMIAQRRLYPQLSFQAIEDTGAGIGLIQAGEVRGTPFRALKASRDKITRSEAVLTRYASHKVFHRSGAAWLSDFEAELLQFPRGSHDDQVDVVAYAGAYLESRETREPGVLSLGAGDLPKMSDLLK